MDRETKFWIIVAFFVSSVIASNLMGNKIAVFGFFDAAVGIMIFPISYLALDIIQEIKGKSTARKILYGSLAALMFVLIVTFIAVALPSAKRDFYPAEYGKIFGISIRVMMASLTAFLLADLMDIEIYARIREWTRTRFLFLRATGSTIVSQFIDSTIFMFLAFYGISPKHDAAYLIALTIPYWLLKCVLAIAGTPLVYWGVRWVGYEPGPESGDRKRKTA